MCVCVCVCVCTRVVCVRAYVCIEHCVYLDVFGSAWNAEWGVVDG